MSEKKEKIARALGIEKGNANADLTKVTGKMDYSYLYTVLEQLPIEKLSMLDICKAIFERISVKFVQEYYEERNLRIKYENTIIDKVRIIDGQERELVRLRALLPKDGEEITKGLT